MQTRAGERGATLLDAVVGTALMLVVFTGISSAFQLAITAVGNNKSRAGAIALGTERLEYVRSLAYDAVGTVGGIPAGAIEQEDEIELNDVTYTRRTFVSYEDDPADGLGASDSNGIPTDYKAAKVTVSWETRQGTRVITMSTRVSPPGIETAVPGGTLSIQVTDDADQPVANAQVRILNPDVSPAVDLTTYTGADGFATMLGVPPGAGYRVAATKPGFSTSQTYGPSATNTNPIPAHLGVALNQTTAATFEIDLLSTFSVATFEPVKEEEWSDAFADASQLSSTDAVVAGGGALSLASEDGAYVSAGTARSSTLAPQYLAAWNEASWTDSAPAGTSVRYHFYTSSGDLVPDADLAGNGAGFTSSPVDLASLPVATYPSLQIGAELAGDTATTPTVTSWTIAYDAGPTPLPDITFAMRGAKTIGSSPQGPVYKYDAEHSSGESASTTFTGFEYDAYTLSLDPADGYDIASSCPAQPVVVAPGATVAAQLHVVPHTTHSLLVDVRAGGATVPGAQVRLSRGAYDTTIEADACGQAFFPDLAAGSVSGGNAYSISVSAPGFVAYSASDVAVSGTTRLTIILND